MAKFNVGFKFGKPDKSLDMFKTQLEIISRMFVGKVQVLDIEIEKDSDNNLNIYMELDGESKPYPKDE